MVATVLCVGITGKRTYTSTPEIQYSNPSGMYHSGVGGGGYMIVKSPDGQVEFVDFREVAPGNNSDITRRKSTNSDFLSCRVPGNV